MPGTTPTWHRNRKRYQRTLARQLPNAKRGRRPGALASFLGQVFLVVIAGSLLLAMENTGHFALWAPAAVVACVGYIIGAHFLGLASMQVHDLLVCAPAPAPLVKSLHWGRGRKVLGLVVKAAFVCLMVFMTEGNQLSIDHFGLRLVFALFIGMGLTLVPYSWMLFPCVLVCLAGFSDSPTLLEQWIDAHWNGVLLIFPFTWPMRLANHWILLSGLIGIASFVFYARLLQRARFDREAIFADLDALESGDDPDADAFFDDMQSITEAETRMAFGEALGTEIPEHYDLGQLGQSIVNPLERWVWHRLTPREQQLAAAFPANGTGWARSLLIATGFVLLGLVLLYLAHFAGIEWIRIGGVASFVAAAIFALPSRGPGQGWRRKIMLGGGRFGYSTSYFPATYGEILRHQHKGLALPTVLTGCLIGVGYALVLFPGKLLEPKLPFTLPCLAALLHHGVLCSIAFSVMVTLLRWQGACRSHWVVPEILMICIMVLAGFGLLLAVLLPFFGTLPIRVLLLGGWLALLLPALALVLSVFFWQHPRHTILFPTPTDN